MADAPVSSGDPLQPDEPERPGEVRGPVSVVLADDQALMRMGFRMVLDAEDGIEVIGEARAQGLDRAPDLLGQPVGVCAALPGNRPLHGGDDTPPAISDNRGDGVGTDIDPYGDDALPTAEGLGKVSGTTHIFSVLGGGMASPWGHHSTQ